MPVYEKTQPFGRGKTMYGGTPADVLSHNYLLGKCYAFEDIDYSVQSIGENQPIRSGRQVGCMLVRNVAVAAILPKQVVPMNDGGTTILEFLGQVLAPSTGGLGRLCVVADEWLPAAGVAPGDIFWVVIEGPTKVTTDTGGDTNFPVGAYIIPGATTAGRVIQQAGNDGNVLGRAIQAVNAVSTDFLLDVIPRI